MVPKLNLGAIPLLPGYGSPYQVSLLKPWYGKRSQQCTERLEREGAPAPDLISHQYGEFAARPAAETASAREGGSGALVPRAPAEERRPGFIANSPRCAGAGGSQSSRPGYLHRAKWLKEDREVLRFFLYYTEPVSESPLESWRVRKVVLLYYRADDTVQMTEPRESNSGMMQGQFLRRVAISQLASPGGAGHLELRDLTVGSHVPIFGREFVVADADAKTRAFFSDSLGVQMPPALSYPVDKFLEKRAAEQGSPRRLSPEAAAAAAAVAAGASALPGHSSAARPKDTLRNFLRYGDKALLFNCTWNDSAAQDGEKRYFQVQVFIADETVQIKETYQANSGREPFPKFLTRSRVVRPDGAALGLADFVVGQNVSINGRNFLVAGCDAATRGFYLKERGFEQPADVVDAAPPTTATKNGRPLPQLQSGSGSGGAKAAPAAAAPEERSFLALMQRPVKRDLERQRKYEGLVLHISVELVSALPQDADRTFDLSYNLADKTLALFEKVKRNSGITGGKYLERGAYVNVKTGEVFTELELGSALLAATQKKMGLDGVADDADKITILKRTYRVYGADDASLRFFGIQRPGGQLAEPTPATQAPERLLPAQL